LGGDTAGEVVDGRERRFCAFTEQSLAGVFAQAADVAQAHAQGNRFPIFKILSPLRGYLTCAA